MNKRQIRVMADYCANPLWNGDVGTGPLTTDEIEELVTSYTLREELYEWQAMYETNTDYLPGDAGQYRKFDYEYFNKWGIAIAHKLARDLPHCEILYFDEIDQKYLQI